MTWWAFLVVVLAAWRTWALISRDLILDRPRDRWFKKGTMRRDWLECPYCSGFWVATGWVGAWVAVDWPGTMWALALWWAASAGVIFVEAIEGRIAG